jgi:hypothetical protein
MRAFVQIYESEEVFMDILASFASQALKEDHTAVVIANDPSPPTLTITVQPAVHITNPLAGSTVKSTVMINANVTGAVGSSNTFKLVFNASKT